jgi:hypothetical protein
LNKYSSGELKKGSLLVVSGIPIGMNGPNQIDIFDSEKKLVASIVGFSMDHNVVPGMWSGMRTGTYTREIYIDGDIKQGETFTAFEAGSDGEKELTGIKF